MAEKIIVLSDGTGNAAASVWRTNVWRTFQALNLEENAQAAKYDDGVGTSSFLPWAILGGAFGWGLKRNILDAYKFVCRNYQSDAKLFLFGFSRGAFTVRVLSAFILDQGLVQATSESELHDLARKAYRSYRAKGYHSIWRIEYPLRQIRDGFVSLWDKIHHRASYNQVRKTRVPTIEFIGVWDTVAAYGLPADEMTRGFSNWIWPLELPNRVLSDRVLFARHAIALDDERTTFHPVLWTEGNGSSTNSAGVEVALPDQRLVQVWFAGMHSNVGGGYPDDALALVPLLWMLGEAARRGLDFKSEPDDSPDTYKTVRSAQDKDGRLYDSRAGLGSYYRYGPRNVADLCNDQDNNVYVALPKIHESVFARIDSGSNAYAPIGLPSNYVMVTADGRSVPSTFETTKQTAARIALQERIWNYVWLRRIVYFFTLAATLHIAAFWLFHPLVPSREFDNPIRLVSESVRLIDSVLPGAFHWWTDWYAANPASFAEGLIAIAVLSTIGSALSVRISDLMKTVWRTRGAADPVPHNVVHSAIFNLRTSRVYRWLIWFGRMQFLPFLFFLFVMWFALTFGSHLLFNVADSMGAFCHGDETNAVPVDKGIDQRSPLEFDTSQICAPTGLKIKNGYKYEITIQITKPWDDDRWSTTPVGYRTSALPLSARWKFYLGVPLRRVIFRPWFRLIARVGGGGVDEYFLNPALKKGDGVPPNTYTARFIADRDGELFLYVNDAVLSLPWINSLFYGNNHGSAIISVRLL